MVGGNIKSDSGATSEAASRVVSGLSDYCSVSLQSISASAPVSGSGTHDAFASSVTSALGAWQGLLNSDANAITSTGLAFEGLDGLLAKNMLGVGGSNGKPF